MAKITRADSHFSTTRTLSQEELMGLTDVGERIQRVLEHALALHITRELVGCTDEEVRKTAEANRAILPTAYIAYLKLGGRTGSLSGGYRVCYPGVVTNKRIALDLFEEEGTQIEQLNGATVIFEHSGYVVMFIKGDEGDDPPVYLYRDDFKEPRQEFARFSLWLLWLVDLMDGYRRSAAGLPERSQNGAA